MSSGTNQERIDQNNVKLGQLKTAVDNLPEYQDIEPIYATADFNTKTTNLSFTYSSNSNYWTFRSRLGKYVYYMHDEFNPYSHFIGKINDNGIITQLWRQNLSSGGSSAYYFPLDYDEDYLYILYCPSTNSSNKCYIRRLNLSTNIMETSDYWVITMPRSYFGNYYRVLKRGVFNFIGYIYRVDCKNKVATLIKRAYSIDSSPRIMYNSQIGAVYTTDSGNNHAIWTLFDYDSGVSHTYDPVDYTSSYLLSTNINAVINNSKVVVNNNLYSLTDSLAKGNLLKENVIEEYSSYMILIEFAPYYFIEAANVSNTSTQSRRVYRFDEDTLTFNKVAVVSDINRSTPGFDSSLHYLSAMMYTNSNYLWQIETTPDISKIIGYTINGVTLMLPTDISSDSNKILNGEAFYNKFGVEVFGTMPNNGALNYTPSTSQQSIPAGYTSGGTIEAVDNTIDENIIAENIKKDVEILGVVGNLESGTDTSDATAAAGDIESGKTAYVNGQKITGTLVPRFALQEMVSIIDESSAGMAFRLNIDAKTLLEAESYINIEATYADVAEFLGITPDKIKAGETICGVTGTYQANENLEAYDALADVLGEEHYDGLGGTEEQVEAVLDNILGEEE